MSPPTDSTARKLVSKLAALAASTNSSSSQSQLELLSRWMIFHRKKHAALGDALLYCLHDPKQEHQAQETAIMLLQVVHKVTVLTVEDGQVGVSPLIPALGEKLLPEIGDKLLLLVEQQQQQDTASLTEMKEIVEYWKKDPALLPLAFKLPSALRDKLEIDHGNGNDRNLLDKEQTVCEQNTVRDISDDTVHLIQNPLESHEEISIGEDEQNNNEVHADEFNGNDGIDEYGAENFNDQEEDNDEIKNQLKIDNSEMMEVTAPFSPSSNASCEENDSVDEGITLEEGASNDDTHNIIDPTTFLNYCQIIAQMQIARDLGGDAVTNLSSALSAIPEEVKVACQTIFNQQQQSQQLLDSNINSTTHSSILELLPTPESLVNLPDEFLDLDLKYIRQSLHTYKEAIRQQRKARSKCLTMLLRSGCSFGSVEAAQVFGVAEEEDDSLQHLQSYHSSDDAYESNDKVKIPPTFPNMKSILNKLQKRKEALSDAMALEGLDVEEDQEMKKKLEAEEKGMVLLDWFPGQQHVQKSKEENDDCTKINENDDKSDKSTYDPLGDGPILKKLKSF